MPIEKINDFLNCYFDVLEIDDKKIRSSIINGIIKRYNKYIDYFPVISKNDDAFENYIIKSDNGYYKLEDFLLNRLFQSLRYVQFKSEESSESCEFEEKSRTIYIAEKAIRKKALSLVSNYPHDSKEIFIKIILFTVFDHELGHALKTQYRGGFKVQYDNAKKLSDTFFTVLNNTLGENKASEIFSSMDFSDCISADFLFKKLISNLGIIKNGKYLSILIPIEELNDNYSYFVGCGIDKQNSIQGIKLTLIDELLQETESMENINCYDIPQGKLRLGNNGNYINVFYLLSGYRFMLGYGKILTSLLGIKDTFQATYLDPSPVLEKFNKQYQNVAKEVFQNDLSPILNISNSLQKIMAEHIERDYLQLDLFFAKCYKEMIMQKLNDGKDLDIDFLLKEIATFQKRLTTNDEAIIRDNLLHNVIFNDLKNILLQFRANNKSI